MYLLAQATSHLTWIDYSILAVYLAGMVGIGVWFSRGQESEEEFLMGGRQMHWLLVTLAAVATAFSGVSLIGAPGYLFSNDARMFMTAPASLIVLPIILLVLPLLVRLRITTVYEYLEQRFSLSIRWVASALFLLSKFLYIGTVIYTPSLLLSTSIEIPIIPSIILMGIIATALTMMGGMKAVMWSDAVQFVIMIGGILVVLLMLVLPDSNGAGGFMEYWHVADAAKKTKMLDWSFNVTELTTWSIIVCMAMAGVSSTFSDQVMMQRYFAAGSSKAVAKSFVMSSLISFPTVALLYLIGLLLFGFYGTGNHDLPDHIRSNGDTVLPFFVSTQLPTGLSGMVIAGIVAATLSTVSSVLNSLVTALQTDFIQRSRLERERNAKMAYPVGRPASDVLEYADPSTSGKSDVLLSRILTVTIGSLGTVLACFVDRLGNIIEQTQTLMGLVGGPLGGIFFLGLFTRRANTAGTAIGAVAGTLATVVVMWGHHWGIGMPTVHFMWYYVVGMGVTVIVGYLTSLLFPPANTSAALTIAEGEKLASFPVK